MYEDRYAAGSKVHGDAEPAAESRWTGRLQRSIGSARRNPWRVLRTKWRVAGLYRGR